jgi:hypothetical protein
VPSIYQPRRPRASPLWQILTAVRNFLRCGDLASGFLLFQCPCCKAPIRLAGAVKRPEQVEFFLRLHGLREGIIQFPRSPPPPFDIETMEPIEPPWQAIKEWIPDDEPDLDWLNCPTKPNEPDPDWFDQSQTWQAPEIHLNDGRTLFLEYT